MNGFDVADLLNAIYRAVLFLPEQASTRARELDTLHYVQITVMTAVTGAAGLAALTFAWRYRRRPGREVGEPVRLGRRAELAVYATILAFFLAFWVVGFSQYLRMGTAPPEALRVYVTAKQWMWKFSYPDGVSSAGVLVVPAGRPVQLLITSRDVIHSFFVPAFRLKRDAVPGTYTATWFEAPEPGRHPVFCAEMCGTGHSRMRAEVVVLRPERWDAWMRGQVDVRGEVSPEAPPLAERGREVAARQGCLACHTLDGTTYVGPSWRGIFGATVALESGERVRVDEAYLTESMMDPQARVVKGFPRIMPSYEGLLEPPEVAALVELIRSLTGPPGAREEARSHER